LNAAPEPTAPACLADYEAVARERLPRLAYYYAGGSYDELTLAENADGCRTPAEVDRSLVVGP
jgi:hypothetical protein